jgi:FkbM family methyltransferase
MGVFQKIGVRKIGILVIEYINWVRFYGMREGSSIFFSLVRKKKGLYKVKGRFSHTGIGLRDNVSDKAIFKQVFLEKQYVNPFFDIPGAATIIDAGANIGASVLWFAHQFPGASIVAVEPEKSNFELLRANTAHDQRVIPLQAAIWYKAEPVIIANPDDQAASFNVETGVTASGIDGITIDSIMAERGWNTIDILKMDIEGAEKIIFSQPNIPWLGKVKVLIIELHDQSRPGCAMTFFKALQKYEYNAYFHHENILIHFVEAK